MRHLFLIPLVLISMLSCAQQSDEATMKKTHRESLNNLETAYFASGCFWCVEAIFESVEGVKEAVSGYAGGTKENPTYREVSYGLTDHAETVKVYYDSAVVNFETLVKVFFESHDPSTKNAQGPDHGTQYRSMAFYQNTEEKDIINRMIKTYLKNGTFKKITTEVVPFETFWEAEAYHQDFERRNPNQGYVRAVSIPRLNRFKEKMPEVLKSE